MHAYDFISLPVRSKKPREQGLTSVLDKGLGVMQLQDFMADAAPYVDIFKFGWGTSRLFTAERLQAKLNILHDNEIYVCPGGTLMEVAFAQNCATEFFKEIKQLGFTCVEISDGTVAMSHEAKLGLIREARKHHLCVLSEIGKKSPREDSELSVEERIAQARAEPQKKQQTWFFKHYGNHVNVGNIAPSEVIPVETLRNGLRADTLREHH